jgi:hypothetical protein
VHFKFKAFQLLQKLKIPSFGDLYKKVLLLQWRAQVPKILYEKEEAYEMKTHQENSVFKTNHFLLLPFVLPLVPVVVPDDEKKKIKLIQFELKLRAGAPTGSSNYKKQVPTFEEGTPQEWLETLRDFEEIWKQNSMNGPSDRMATVVAVLKGSSLTAFESALLEARVDREADDDVVQSSTLKRR